MVEGALKLCAHALKIVIVARFLAVEARVIDYPGFWGRGRDVDVEALVVFV
jgi:hypothetical protein